MDKLEKQEQIKKSTWGGKREGAGRKPLQDYSIRDLFKEAFDEYVTEEKWKLFIKEMWESGDWQKQRFLIEQRIGKAPKTTFQYIESSVDLDSLIDELSDPE